jgi:hypothetical protein
VHFSISILFTSFRCDEGFFTRFPPRLGRLNTTSRSEVPFITNDLSSFGLVRPDNREIDLGIKGDVDDSYSNQLVSRFEYWLVGFSILRQGGIYDLRKASKPALAWS